MSPQEDLLDRMRASPHGWKQRDIDSMLLSYGFRKVERGDHTWYRHDALPPGSVVSVPRHRSVKAVYIKQAVKAADLVRGMPDA